MDVISQIVENVSPDERLLVMAIAISMFLIAASLRNAAAHASIKAQRDETIGR